MNERERKKANLVQQQIDKYQNVVTVARNMARAREDVEQETLYDSLKNIYPKILHIFEFQFSRSVGMLKKIPKGRDIKRKQKIQEIINKRGVTLSQEQQRLFHDLDGQLLKNMANIHRVDVSELFPKIDETRQISPEAKISIKGTNTLNLDVNSIFGIADLTRVKIKKIDQGGDITDSINTDNEAALSGIPKVTFGLIPYWNIDGQVNSKGTLAIELFDEPENEVPSSTLYFEEIEESIKDQKASNNSREAITDIATNILVQLTCSEAGINLDN